MIERREEIKASAGGLILMIHCDVNDVYDVNTENQSKKFSNFRFAD